MDLKQHTDSLTKFTDPDPRGSKAYGSADPDLAPEDNNLIVFGGVRYI
jgi:hypothetical protein